MPNRRPRFRLPILHHLAWASALRLTSLTFRLPTSASPSNRTGGMSTDEGSLASCNVRDVRYVRRIISLHKMGFSIVALVLSTMIGVSSYAQDISPTWDVRVNQNYWHSLPAVTKDKAIEKFRALGLLRGNGKIIPDHNVDHLAIKVEGGIKEDDGWFEGWLNIESPSSCSTRTGEEYVKGEIRKDTNQRCDCDCGWFSCGWVDVVSQR